jgi:hypothetical protein
VDQGNHPFIQLSNRIKIVNATGLKPVIRLLGKTLNHLINKSAKVGKTIFTNN